MVQRKPEGERSNRKPLVFPNVTLIRDGKIRGPEPKDHWAEETKEFWAWVRQSAQAQQFHDSDWLTLKIAFDIHSQLHSPKAFVDQKSSETVMLPITPGERRALAAEFRTYVAPYGFTHQDRIRYGITVKEAEDVATEARSAEVEIDYREIL